MDTQRILCYIDILREIAKGPIRLADITKVCSPTRSTIHDFIQDAEDWSLVQRTTNGYTLTAAGNLVLREYDQLDADYQSKITSFIGTRHGLDVFSAIDTQPADRATLARRAGVDRSTVQRNIDNHIEPEWIDEEHEHINLTPKGNKLLENHQEFEHTIRIIEDKIKFLERYEGEDIAKPPLEALANSRQVVSTTADREEVVRELKEIEPIENKPLRALSQAFSADIGDKFTAKLPIDAETEVIVNRSVYRALSHPKRWKHLSRLRHRQNNRLLVLSHNVQIGLVLNGNEQAVIAAHNAQHPFHVALFGRNEALINWVAQMYEYFRVQANPPPKDLYKWATGF